MACTQKPWLVTIDRVEAMKRAACRNDETIREILRLELEIAAGCSSRNGNQSAANFLRAGLKKKLSDFSQL